MSRWLISGSCFSSMEEITGALGAVCSKPQESAGAGMGAAAPRPSAAAPAGNTERAAFFTIFDSSEEALLLVDPAGAIVRANRWAAELLGVSATNQDAKLSEVVEIASRPEQESSRYWARNTFPAIGAVVEGAVANRGWLIRLMLRAVVPGTEDFLLGATLQDANDRGEASASQSESELRSVLDAASAGIILFDSSGRVRSTNSALAQILALEPAEIDRLRSFGDWESLAAARFREPRRFAEWRSSFAPEPGTILRHELETARPGRRVLERVIRPVWNRAGQATGWLESYTDVTSERQIQSKMLQTEKMVALGQLVSGIAHELNNPLTAIMGYAQLLLGHGLSEQQRSDAGKVYHEAERARHIVKNLLYFARGNKPERVRVNLNEIVERTLALRSYELKVENIAVHCDLAPNLPETLADPFQFQQVVLNLLVNAEQALLEARGRGRVWIRTRARLAGKSRRLVFEVSDDGPGIPPEIASRVFDPFFTTKPPGVGTGLGLSIVYGIVQQHGGEVSLESHPGAGAKFVVEIPLVMAPVAERPASYPAPSPAAQTRPGARILVVEDEPTVARLIADVLSEENHQVEAVLDSREGLARLAQAQYDLVICDLRMPRLDGPAFYEALEQARSPMRQRIIFVTGDTLAPRTMQFLERNHLPYLAKPFLVEELKLAVQRALVQRENRKTNTATPAAKGLSARPARRRAKNGRAARRH